MKQRIDISKLYNGTSDQPPYRRQPGQSDIARNTRLDPTDGARSRNATELIGDMAGLDAGASYYWTSLRQFIIAIGNGIIKAWDRSNTPIQVEDRTDTTTVSSANVALSGIGSGTQSILAKCDEFQPILHPVGRLLPEEARARRAELPENCQVVFLGTYQSPQSIYLPPEDPERPSPFRSVTTRKFPAMVQDPEGGEVAGFEGRWRAVFPERLNLDDLRRKRDNMSAQKFALHFLLDPTAIAASSAPFSWQQVEQLKGERTPRVLEAWVDPATGAGDETALLFGAADQGKLYVAALLGWADGNSFSAMERVVEECTRRNVAVVHIEAQHPTLPQVLERVVRDRGARIRVEPFNVGHSNKGKLSRITENLEPAVTSGALVLHPSVLWQPQFREQMLKLRYDQLPEPNDRIDVLASFVAQRADRIRTTKPFQLVGARYA